jgi:hypothetical protein
MEKSYNENNLVLHYTMCFRSRFGPYFPAVNGGNKTAKTDLDLLSKITSTGIGAPPISMVTTSPPRTSRCSRTTRVHGSARIHDATGSLTMPIFWSTISWSIIGPTSDRTI